MRSPVQDVMPPPVAGADEGYERVVREPHPRAVRWWYSSRGADGYRFARGGIERTCRIARRRLRSAREQDEKERAELAHLLRSQFALAADGALVPLAPIPGGRRP